MRQFAYVQDQWSFGLARAYEELGLFDQAESVFREWLIRAGEHPDERRRAFVQSWAMAARSYLRAMRWDTAGALTGLDSARARDPRLPSVYQGFTHVALLQWDPALAALRPFRAARYPAMVQMPIAIEAVRGRPHAALSELSAARGILNTLPGSPRDTEIAFTAAEASLFALDDPERAAALLAPFLAGRVPADPTDRRTHAAGAGLAAALCALAPDPSGGARPACGLEARTDSVRDEIETLERLAWEALARDDAEGLRRIAAAPIIERSGSWGRKVLLPLALLHERLGELDQAAVLYEEIVAAHARVGGLPNMTSSWVRRSFALRRLARFPGEVGQRARAQLRRDWSDAEPAFMERVGNAVLSGGQP